MSTKKPAAKKGAKKGAKNAKKGGGAMDELRTMIEALKKEIDSLKKSIKNQNKRIQSLETDNKRQKKAIQKIQMNGGSGGNLLPPSSDTVAAYQSDVESSPQPSIPDESKEQKEEVADAKPAKSPKAAKPKPVARRNKPKPQKKADDIKWTFDLNHPGKSQKFLVVDNGQTALKPPALSGTFRFGRFVHFTKNNTDNLASFTIVFDTRSIGTPSALAMGFATDRFGHWVGTNFGQNNCCYIKGNGDFCTTDKVFECVDGKEYAHRKKIDALIDPENKRDGFFNAGHDVCVHIDLKNNLGKVWNDTTNKDAEDNGRVFEMKLPDNYEICIIAYMVGSKKSDNGRVFEMKLPDNYEICIIAYMVGSKKSKLAIKDQTFKFNEQEEEE
eukprot:CAMPEP_0197074218 /NCGR_PEP_ID=MMETSP1384-20130603/211000_1 /TAXON_ID=29189 /ORGANISM="Ammonia sp." /LENGTH=384 /DNA_ID=CAMNT_0042513059 /DNA_START=23 /DNA_END=1177 /DNA_ORIENTATION=+